MTAPLRGPGVTGAGEADFLRRFHRQSVSPSLSRPCWTIFQVPGSPIRLNLSYHSGWTELELL